ncbi:MAG: type 4a pilus biogenesis protein PilO [Deltaproteobacteria bacterium]|nr:type 4a pilus biogenesis protein PilO [Deltaproteobacteria bacterium]
MLDQFLKMPLSKKLAILGILVVMIGFLFWQFYYSPLKSELDAKKSEHSRILQKLKEVEIQKKTYDEDLQKREDLKNASVKQRLMLPVTTEMASFVQNINSVAELTGLDIISVKPLEASPDKYYSRIPVELNLEGSYLQIGKFFYQVGKLDRIINIENITLDKPKIGEDGVLLHVKALATTFRALEPNEKTGKKK